MNLWKRIWLGIEEAVAFGEQPSRINGIEEQNGRILTVQAPALKYLKPDIPTEVNLRFISKDHEGNWSGFADGPVRRTVVRRDCGIIPLYYFV